MAEGPGAVFLSYASQDAGAARRICEALRAGGIEVWFDQSELRGGDAWDRSIRQQIHDCALFIPVISRQAHERLEGYFRREWRLAIERAGDMAENKAFLVPVVLDDTTEQDRSIPEKFRDLQWTRLPDGAATGAFVARVAHLLDGGEPGAPARPGAADEPAPAPRTSVSGVAPSSRPKLLPLLVAALVLLAVGYFALDRLVPKKDPAGPLPGEPGRNAAAAKSIAVLPFVDMSERHDQQYLGDGLAEELIDELARVPGLKVIGRTSSFQFKDKADDLRLVGKALGAVYVVEGSVRRSGDEVRVTAQLIDARDGSHLWSKSYDREMKDSLALQQDVATAIARTLEVTVTDQYQVASKVHSAEAYELYLRSLRDLDSASAESDRQAVAELQRVTAMEPEFAPAWIELASAYNQLAMYFYMPTDEGFARAKHAIEQALKVDPRNPQAYAVRALIRVNYDWNWDGAESDVKRCTELGGSPDVYLPAAKLAAARGDLAQAIAQLEQALASDPLDWNSYWILATKIYPSMQRFDDMDRAFAKMHEINAENMDFEAYFVGYAQLLAGRLDQAQATANTVKGAGERDALRAMILAARGRTGEFNAAVKSAAEVESRWNFAVARAYAYGGDKAKALEYLDKSVAEREGDMWYLTSDPSFRRLAGDTRFTTLLRNIGLGH